MNKHYINEVGTDLVFDTGVDIGTATEVFLRYSNPTGSGVWTATKYSSYSEIAGAIGTYFVKYTLASTSFNVSGKWEFQPHVGAVDGTWYGETVGMEVFAQFE